MTAPRRSTARQLLEDGSLEFVYPPAVATLVERWLPRFSRSDLPPRLEVPPLPENPAQTEVPEGTEAPARSRAVIEVRDGGARVTTPEGRPTLSLGDVRAWHLPPDRVVLCGRAAACAGTIDLDRRAASLEVKPGSGDIAAADLYSSLTIAAAFLLGRQRRALIHAAAAVAPSGRGWLLVGDARSGKSTTCAGLISRGWAYLSDDQVVVSHAHSDASPEPRDAIPAGGGAGGSGGSTVPGVGEVSLEGWPRDFHLDEGWEAGVPTGSRRSVDPRLLGPGGWQPRAPLAGTLLTEVASEQPTALSAVHPAETLAALVRQAPWLMADPVAAPACLELLTAAAAHPGFRLTLGADCFGDAARLEAVLGPLTA